MKKVEKIKGNIQSFIVVLIMYLSCMSTAIGNNNATYGIGQIHTYNNNIFHGNIFCNDTIVSPRYILDNVCAFIMKFNGGKWQDVVVAFMYISLLIFSIGTIVLAGKITEEKKVLWAIIWAMLFLTRSENQILGAGGALFELDSIGIGAGRALAMLAIAFVLGRKKNFNLAWIILALASFFHIHEGIYGFAAVFLIYLAQCIYQRKVILKEIYTICICILGMGISVVPGILTDSLNISSQQFVNIYAMYRHSHHLVPSTWEIDDIWFSFLTILFSILIRFLTLQRQKKREELNAFLIEAVLLASSWIGALFIMWIGAEKIYSVTIVTMVIVKYFKYVGLIAMYWYVKTVYEYWSQKLYLESATVLTFAMVEKEFGYYAILLFFIVMAFLYFAKYIKQKEVERASYLLVALIESIVFIVYSCYLSYYVLAIIILVYIVITIFEGMYKRNNKKYYRVGTVGFLFIALFLSIKGDVYEYDGEFLIKTPIDFLINSCGRDIYELSEKYNSKTDVDQQFIADSSDEGAAWVQIVSQRNCFVSKGVVPSNKNNINEWYERCQITEGLLDKEDDDIRNLMESEGIYFIIVDKAHFEKFDQMSDYKVSVECESDTYRMYQYGEIK